jgi:hypothetical protein
MERVDKERHRKKENEEDREEKTKTLPYPPSAEVWYTQIGTSPTLKH